MAKRRTIIIGAGHASGRAAEALRVADNDRDIMLIGNESHLPYERPPLSKGILWGHSTPADTLLFPQSWYDDQHVEVRLKTVVTGLDRTLKIIRTNMGESLPYDDLLIATGARARML